MKSNFFLNKQNKRLCKPNRTTPMKGQTVTISIDTTKLSVAKQAILSGANIINDVSAGEDSNGATIEFSAIHNIPLVLMHRLAPSLTMQNDPKYEDVVNEVYTYLENKARNSDSIVPKVFFAVSLFCGCFLGTHYDWQPFHAFS